MGAATSNFDNGKCGKRVNVISVTAAINSKINRDNSINNRVFSDVANVHSPRYIRKYLSDDSSILFWDAGWWKR